MGIGTWNESVIIYHWVIMKCTSAGRSSYLTQECQIIVRIE